MPISFRSRSPRWRKATRFAWRSRCAITRSTKRPRRARKTATPLRIAGAALRVVALSIVMDFPSRKGLRSALRPFVGISMHVAAFQDFQRTAICSPNAREMRLRFQAAALIRLVQPDRGSDRREADQRGHPQPVYGAVKPLKYLRFLLHGLLRRP